MILSWKKQLKGKKLKDLDLLFLNTINIKTMLEDFTLDGTNEKKLPERIGFGPRLVSSLLDTFIMLTIIPIIAGSLASTKAADFLIQKGMDVLKADDNALEMIEKTMGEYFNFYLILIALLTTFGIVYNLIEGFFGASPGKMIMGLKVANADGSKGDVNLFMKRWFIKNANAVLVIINLIVAHALIENIASMIGLVIFFGCFAVLGNKKQALHDTLANTAVYKKKEILD
jgi:uncharacterized RDD family membrane protein YckC